MPEPSAPTSFIAATSLQGTIIKVPGLTPGLVFVKGAQRAFQVEGIWQSPVAPLANQIVDVDLDREGAVISIRVRDVQQRAKAAVEQHGRQAVDLARTVVGALAARMGRVTLGATVALWLAWFFLPTLTVMRVKVLTFWDLLGLDETLGAAGLSHGLFALLGLGAIAAPFIAPFVRHPRARLLNLAPAAFVILSGLRLWWTVRQAFGAATRAGDQFGMGAYAAEMTRTAMKTFTSSLSVGWGLFVVVGAALVLAATAMKSHARQKETP